MKKTHVPLLLAICSIALVGGVSSVTHAEFNLDKLKAMAEKAKAYQESLNQNSTPAPSNGSETTSEPSAGPMQTGSPSNGASIRKNIDIVGIRLGMSLDEAIKILRQHNPKLSIVGIRKLPFENPKNPTHPGHVILQDAPNNYKESVQLYVSLPPRAQIVEVQRELIYQKGGAPARETALTALAEKYGAPSINQKEYQFSNLTWYVDKKPTGRYIDGCHPKPGIFGNIYTIKPTRAICGMVLNARINAESSNPMLTSQISTTLTDHELIFELASESRLALANMAAKRQADELGAATKNEKPKF